MGRERDGLKAILASYDEEEAVIVKQGGLVSPEKAKQARIKVGGTLRRALCFVLCALCSLGGMVGWNGRVEWEGGIWAVGMVMTGSKKPFFCAQLEFLNTGNPGTAISPSLTLILCCFGMKTRMVNKKASPPQP